MVEEIDLEKWKFRNFPNFSSPVTLTLTLNQVSVLSASTIHAGLSAHQLCYCSFKEYGNVAIWNSHNVDIPQSLNSRESFLSDKL